ncbi:MAG: hypothetical protein LBK95_06505 [Bifidobacteriaceae bacterium]|nr:hypothetical protein [Bifidobacteriaceae bacterium]
MTKKLLGLLTVVVFGAAGLAGCEAAPSKDEPSASADDSRSGSAAASAEGKEYEPSQYTEVPGGLPLTPYFKAYDALSEAVQTGESAREWTERGNQRDVEVASCMKAAGFEYYPERREPPKSAAFDPWVEFRGDLIGVPYLPDTIEQVRATGYGTDSTPEPSEEAANPTAPDPSDAELKNQEYRESLSASAQVAYEKALTGWDGTNEERRGEPGGCSAAATEKYPEPVADDRFNKVRNLHRSVIGGMGYLTGEPMWTDTVVVTLDRDWESCMLGKGYKFETGGPSGSGWSPFRSPTEAMVRASLTGADGTVAPPGADGVSLPEDQRSLVGSQAEIAIAVDDFECRQETDYMDTLIGRMRSLQEEFIAENQKALDEFMAAVEDLNL